VKYISFEGACEGIAFIEHVMEHVAKVIKKDPIDVRLKNLKKDDPNVQNMIEDLKIKADFEERKRNVEEFNKVSSAVYHISVFFCRQIYLEATRCSSDHFWLYNKLLTGRIFVNMWCDQIVSGLITRWHNCC